jgi:hypothetical protein
VRLTAAIAVLVAGCATASLPAPGGERPALDERVQALNEVINVRYSQLATEPPVDVCSMYLVLDRDASLIQRLGQFARARLGEADLASCPTSLDVQRRDHGWYVRGIVRRRAGELIVTADANAHGGHRETFFLRHGYGDPQLWRVVEVRLTDFWFE